MTLQQQIDGVLELCSRYPKIKLDDAEIIEKDKFYDCPLCDGNGEMEGAQYINLADKPVNILVSGIGEDFIILERVIESIPTMVEIIRKQSEMLKVAKEALSKLACLGNEPFLGNSEGNMIARKSLATIEQMEKADDNRI